MIPVLGVPVLNRPDLLARMIASIDVPVERIIVIDNSIAGITQGIEFPANTQVVHIGHNLGVAASWNLIVKASPTAGWWCVVNSDVEFTAGDLDRLTVQIESAPRIFAFLATLTAFGLTPEVHEAVGWFDENYVPAYGEDNDFVRRCSLAGIAQLALPTAHRHDPSSTIASDLLAFSENGKTFAANMSYHRDKWGGAPGGEAYNTPFDAGGDVRDWRLPLSRLRDQTWRLK